MGGNDVAGCCCRCLLFFFLVFRFCIITFLSPSEPAAHRGKNKKNEKFVCIPYLKICFLASGPFFDGFFLSLFLLPGRSDWSATADATVNILLFLLSGFQDLHPKEKRANTSVN